MGKRDVTTQRPLRAGSAGASEELFSGESLFMSRYTANGPAEIAFASSFPGAHRRARAGAGAEHHLP